MLFGCGWQLHTLLCRTHHLWLFWLCALRAPPVAPATTLRFQRLLQVLSAQQIARAAIVGIPSALVVAPRGTIVAAPLSRRARGRRGYSSFPLPSSPSCSRSLAEPQLLVSCRLIAVRGGVLRREARAARRRALQPVHARAARRECHVLAQPVNISTRCGEVRRCFAAAGTARGAAASGAASGTASGTATDTAGPPPKGSAQVAHLISARRSQGA